MLARAVAGGTDPATLRLPLEDHVARQRQVVSQFEKLAVPPEVVRLDPAARLCDEKGCKVVDGNVTLYNDYQHLTGTGAEWIAPLFEPAFEELAKGQ